MALTLHCKRSKIFNLPGSTINGHGEKKFLIAAGQTVQAPNWIRDTGTYKYGLKDKSIVDLTSPAPTAPSAHVPATKEEARAEDVVLVTKKEVERVEEGVVAVEPTDEELEKAQKVRTAKNTRMPQGFVKPSMGKTTK